MKYSQRDESIYQVPLVELPGLRCTQNAGDQPEKHSGFNWGGHGALVAKGKMSYRVSRSVNEVTSRSTVVSGESSEGQRACKGRRLFLVSPANLSGRRAQMLLRPAAGFELAERLRSDRASLGDVFSFVSGLYFRGKLAYARAFCTPDPAAQSVLVITAGHGLVSPDALGSFEQVVQMAEVSIDSSERRYREPLERDIAQLASQIGDSDEVVLLGSIATPKYLEPLAAAFGNQLSIPVDFIGRGDMSRGSLMLKAVRARMELEYIAVQHLEIEAYGKARKRGRSR